jgi:hypothetical protein
MSRRSTRRDFARLCALSAALPIAACRTPLPLPPPEAAPEPAPAPAAEAPSSNLAAALTAVVSAQYGEFLDRGEMERVETNIGRMSALYHRLREFELVNSDEPDVIFTATPWSRR